MTVHVDMLCAYESTYRSALFYVLMRVCVEVPCYVTTGMQGWACVWILDVVDMHLTCHTKNDKQ